MSILRIEELTTAGGSSPRSVTLQGGSLPFQGAEWGSDMTITTTWFPGNGDEGSQQILGPKELPSAMSGRWSQVVMGDPDSQAVCIDATGVSIPVSDPQALSDFLESIARDGQRLRVTYSREDASGQTEGIRKVREGRIKTFKAKLGYAQDVEWTMDFVWVSRGKLTQPIVATRPPSVTSSSAKLDAAISAFLQRVNNPANALPAHLTLGQLNRLAHAPMALVTALTRSVQQIQSNLAQAVGIIATIATTPAQVVSQALSFAQDSVNQANTMVQLLGEIPVEYHAVKSNAADVIVAAQTFAQMSDAAQVIASAAQDFYDQFRANVRAMPGQSTFGSRQSANAPGDLLDIFRTKAGDTPQTISMKYYQSPDHGVDILRANGLPWHQSAFTPGTLLVIPVLSATGAALQA